MKKSELAVLVSSSLMALSMHADADCRGRGHASGTGWGFSCDSAIEDARDEACRGCHRGEETCGETKQTHCEFEWTHYSGWVSVQCCSDSSG